MLHVRICAPFELRVERIAEQQNQSHEAARVQVQASDLSRKRYLRRYYHAGWDDPDLYDVLINTADFSAQAAAGVVCEALRQKIQNEDHSEERVNPLSEEPKKQPVFIHPIEAAFARILDFYGVKWEYEPRTFPSNGIKW